MLEGGMTMLVCHRGMLTVAWRLADRTTEIKVNLSSALPDDPLSSSTCHSLERAERGFLTQPEAQDTSPWTSMHPTFCLVEKRSIALWRLPHARFCLNCELLQLCDSLTNGSEQSAKQALLIFRGTKNFNKGEHPAYSNLRRR